MKITIIMPTFNDSKTIIETLDSVYNQNYKDWVLLISDDGSTDNTKDIVKKYISSKKEKRIKYIYHENGDQLNAINYVIDDVDDDSLVLVLHSDDILCNTNTLKNIVDCFKNESIDTIITDLPKMNENGEDTGIQKTKKYKRKKYIPALQLLWLGRNLYADTFVTKASILKDKIRSNYILWNTPFWLDLETCKMLNVKKVNFPIIKYRVFEGNYINNEIGKLNVLNGELRTAVFLMKKYSIPFYKFQYLIFRTFNKLHINYIPLYLNKETENKYEVLSFIINKRFSSLDNVYLKNLLEFYKLKDNRIIEIDNISKNDFIYYGKDMRRFNNDLLKGTVSNIYKKIIDEMAKGFSKIIVKNQEDYEKMMIITKFLNISPFITIEISNEHKKK